MEFLFSCGIIFSTLLDNNYPLVLHSNQWKCLRESPLKDLVDDNWNPADIIHQFDTPLIWYLKQPHTDENEQNIALLLKHGDYEFNQLSNYLHYSPTTKRFTFEHNNTYITFDTLLTLIARNQHYYALNWILHHNLTVDFNQIETIQGETVLHILARQCTDVSLLKRIITDTNIITTIISKNRQTYKSILEQCSNASNILPQLTVMENAFRVALVNAIMISNTNEAVRLIGKIIDINERFGIQNIGSNIIVWTNSLKIALSQQSPSPIIIRALLDNPFILYTLNEAVACFSILKDVDGFKDVLTKYITLDVNAINSVDQFGSTPLIISISYSFYYHDIIDLILSIPTLDVNILNREGYSAIHFAIKTTDLKLISKVIYHRSFIPSEEYRKQIRLWMRELHFADITIQFVCLTISNKRLWMRELIIDGNATKSSKIILKRIMQRQSLKE
eukprot:235204_1